MFFFCKPSVEQSQSSIYRWWVTAAKTISGNAYETMQLQKVCSLNILYYMTFWSCYLFIRGLSRSFEGVSICCIWLLEAGAHSLAVDRLFKNLTTRKTRHIYYFMFYELNVWKIKNFVIMNQLDWTTVVPWATAYILRLMLPWKVISTQHMFPGSSLWFLSGEEDL